jgi:hypothetical protein
MTNVPPKQVVQQGPSDFDALLHGQYIGSFSSELQAWTELNQVHFEQVRDGIVPLHSDAAGTDPDIERTRSDDLDITIPVPPADLEAAAARLRSDPALKKALGRLLEGGWSYIDQDDGALLLRFEPRSKGRGKKTPSTYTTSQDGCTCPGAIIRGACYHPLAWHIVNEALTPTTSLEAHVPYATLLPLCLLALSAGTEHVTLMAESDHGTITLAAQDWITSTIHVEMSTLALLRIEHRWRSTDLKRVIDALAATVPPDLPTVTLDIARTSLVIMASSADELLFFDGIDALPALDHDEQTA